MFKKVDCWSSTERGAGGFGSAGTQVFVAFFLCLKQMSPEEVQNVKAIFFEGDKFF